MGNVGCSVDAKFFPNQISSIGCQPLPCTCNNTTTSSWNSYSTTVIHLEVELKMFLDQRNILIAAQQEIKLQSIINISKSNISLVRKDQERSRNGEVIA